MNIKKKGLKFRFIFFVSSLIIFTSCLSLISSVTRERYILINNIIKTAKTNIELFSFNLFNNNENLSKIDNIAKIILKNENICSINIYNNKNKIIKKYIKKNYKLPLNLENISILEKTYFDINNFFLVTKNIKKNKKIIFKIKIILSAKNIKEKINSIIIENIIQTFVIASFGFFIAVFLSQIVIDPIDKLILGVKNIASGDYNFRISMDSEKEIASLAHEINFMARNLQKTIESAKFIALGKLSASIAHEIRTPLVSIKSLIELWKNNNKLKEYEQDMKIILKEVNRINNFVNQLLNYAKPPQNKTQLININNILDDILYLIKPTFKNKNIEIICNYNNIKKIMLDEEKTKQIFINIIINSFQAIPENGKIIIETKQNKEKLFIRIIDNGPGISKDILETIFEPFTTTKPSGTGLGLSIAKKMINIQNGNIKIEKTSINGTTFLVEFNLI